MRVLVTGAGGMLGRAVIAHCAARGDEVFAHEHQSLDITKRQSVIQTFERERPDVVINCAAWTDVDGCERDAARAFDVNARGPQHLAVACREECAQVALKAAGCDTSLIESVSFETLKRPAPRPRNSRLRCLRSKAIGLPPLPDWREAVKQWSVASSQ